MCLLKEYLGQKYGRKVRFILPTGDPAGDLLDGKGFYPCSVTIYDKYGFAACSSAVSVELTAEGKILIPTDETGKIHDAEEYLSNDDLLSLCGTVEEYERLLPEIRKELAENGNWKEFAEECWRKNSRRQKLRCGRSLYGTAGRTCRQKVIISNALNGIVRKNNKKTYEPCQTRYYKCSSTSAGGKRPLRKEC